MSIPHAVSGTALMCTYFKYHSPQAIHPLLDINNVGSISQALYAKSTPEYDEIEAAQWQATQVSAVSISNCLGRIIIGNVYAFLCSSTPRNHIDQVFLWIPANVSLEFEDQYSYPS